MPLTHGPNKITGKWDVGCRVLGKKAKHEMPPPKPTKSSEQTRKALTKSSEQTRKALTKSSEQTRKALTKSSDQTRKALTKSSGQKQKNSTKPTKRLHFYNAQSLTPPKCEKGAWRSHVPFPHFGGAWGDWSPHTKNKNLSLHGGRAGRKRPARRPLVPDESTSRHLWTEGVPEIRQSLLDLEIQTGIRRTH